MGSDPVINNPERLFAIGQVSEITGVNPVTLRAWQRRYGLLKPSRTPKGHRLYSETDVERVHRILYWLDQGVSISQVRGLLESPQAQVTPVNNEPLEDLVKTATELNPRHLDNRIRELTRMYPTETLLRKILEPWLQRLAILERPDAVMIQHMARQQLAEVICSLMKRKSGPQIGFAWQGRLPGLQRLLMRFELQELGCRSVDLGECNSQQLALTRDRLDCDAWIIVPGGGLTLSWFRDNAGHWPHPAWFVGELVNVYERKGWLNLKCATTITELSRSPDGPACLVQK